MTSKKNRARAPKEINKKFKKKTSVLVTDKVDFIDYKDVNLLNRFVSDRSKIRNRRVTGNTVQQQRDIANAVKNAREMALAAVHQARRRRHAPVGHHAIAMKTVAVVAVVATVKVVVIRSRPTQSFPSWTPKSTT